MKVLITGGAGFVGRNLARFFAQNDAVILADLVSPPAVSANATAVALDVCDSEQVTAVIKEISPDAVLHLAGNKNVLYCEQHPEEAQKINAGGTKNVAKACRLAGAQMLYLSTDLVFDCLKGGYRETDVPVPTSVYGKTKLQGESDASRELPSVAICRSGGIYGPQSPLLNWLKGELEANRQVECLTNVRNTPTYVDHLGEMLKVIVKRRLSGVFHIAGADIVNRYEFFHAFASAFDLPWQLLRPIESEELMNKMMLSPNAALDSEWTSQTLAIPSMTLKEGFSRMKAITCEK